MSPTSSRKSVPPSAASNLPLRRAKAPVKAPFSWPNSSDSSRLSVRAAQETATKGPPARVLSWWTARARTSLPLPDSPRTRMVELARAAVRASSKIACMAGLLETRSRNRYSCLRACRRTAFSRTSACCATIFCIISDSSSGSNGFTR